MNKNIFSRRISLFLIVLFLTVSIAPFVSSIKNSEINYENNSIPLNMDWWPMFHHDAVKNGYSTSSAPDTDDVLWSYNTNNIISSSPAVSNGKVFIGCADKKLYCFEMMNGSILWNFTTSGKISSSPAVYNGRVYVGSQDSIFYCLDAENGSQIWQYDINFMIESSPTIKDGKVFFGSSGGILYCLDVETGSLIWEYSAGNVIWSSPAVTDSKIYFGTHTGYFICLDIENGELIWSNKTSSGIWTSPTVYNGKVYFGSNNFYVYCFDADNGNFIWSYNLNGEVHSSPAIAYGNLYIGSSGQGLFCLDAETGNLVWKYLINDGVWSPPSVADGKVYFGTDPCCGSPSYFHCSDAFTGEHIWKYNTGGEVAMKSSPAIAAGIVFVGGGNGIIFAFGGKELYADANGPYNGVENTPILFKGSAYGGKPDYTWHWDFGDTITSDEQNPVHTYTIPGNYKVTLTVTDENYQISNDTTYAYVKNENRPPETPDINGPINGKPKASYNYTFNAADPDGNDIKYNIDWGESYFDNTSFYPSGSDVIVAHTWEIEGTYLIKAQAEDTNGVKSNWAEYTVTMPREKTTSSSILNFLENHPNLFTLFQKFFQLLVLQ
ncbi:hypothetical protein AYK24_02105 [Thermoplasmatales archaeon SG8-52-4]|nr:MAG: hypothetical protein AYK24_02105 [Thermoplasmatales archaeon SG8-52-4]